MKVQAWKLGFGRVWAGSATDPSPCCPPREEGGTETLLFAHSRRDDRKAAVDVGNLAGHRAGKVGEEKRGDVADLVDRHVPTQRRVLFDEVKDLGEPAD